MTAIDITRVVLFSYITFWLGFIGLSGAAFLLEPIAVPALLHLPVATARPVGVLFLGLIAAFLGASFVRKRPFAFKGLELAVPRPPMAGGADRHRLARLGVRRPPCSTSSSPPTGTSPSSTSSASSCSPRSPASLSHVPGRARACSRR